LIAVFIRGLFVALGALQRAMQRRCHYRNEVSAAPWADVDYSAGKSKFAASIRTATASTDRRFAPNIRIVLTQGDPHVYR
jgi:hypothetical protein